MKIRAQSIGPFKSTFSNWTSKLEKVSVGTDLHLKQFLKIVATPPPCPEARGELKHKHSFSLQRCFIWNNRCILFKHESIFLKSWFDKGIILACHLFNTQGYLMTHDEFLAHFNFPVTPTEFSLVLSAINPAIVSLFRNVILADMPIVNLTDTVCGKISFSQTKNDKSIRSLFLKEVATKSCSVSYWTKFVRNPKWESIWLLPHKFFVTNR